MIFLITEEKCINNFLLLPDIWCIKALYTIVAVSVLVKAERLTNDEFPYFHFTGLVYDISIVYKNSVCILFVNIRKINCILVYPPIYVDCELWP